MTFIYLVEIDNNKVYIGKTINPEDREKEHKLTYGKHIIYTIIDEVNSFEYKDWEPLETFWINQFKTWGFDVVNTRQKGGSGPSFHSEESKQKIKEKLINRDISSWKHKIYTFERNKNISQTRGEGIIQTDMSGSFIKEWTSFNEVYNAGYVGIAGAIRRDKPYKNFIWKRKKDLL